MTIALRSAHLLRALIPVDNAPLDASLSSDFPKYIEGLLEVERLQPQKQVDADHILEQYEKVYTIETHHLLQFLPHVRILQFDNSS